MRKILAFTLAETLLVIGIIGVVSALTLPNLNSSTGDKEKVAKVKKIYQNLSDALGRAEAVYGPYEEWFVNDPDDAAKRAKRAGERMTEFMKLSKNCELGQDKGCFTKGNSKSLKGDNEDIWDNHTDVYKFITADGISIGILKVKDKEFQIIIDIDGPNSGAYTLGKDLFWFLDYPNLGIMPLCYEKDFADILSNVKKDGRGTYAAAWITKFDNADYLKLDANGKCPNGTVPTEQNPRCK